MNKFNVGSLQLKVRDKLLIAFVLIFLFMAGAAVVTTLAFNTIQRHTQFMLEASSLNIKIIEDLKISTIQLQQYITDACVTNEADSFLQAERNAKTFRTALKNLPEQCNSCHASSREAKTGSADDGNMLTSGLSE
ncbi:MCP four helix bundle domain-containing protein, partial [Nitrospirota bacterium]